MAPSMRVMFGDKRAAPAVLTFLRDTRVGRMVLTIPRDDEWWGEENSEGGKGGSNPPWSVFSLSYSFPLSCFLPFFLSGGLEKRERRALLVRLLITYRRRQLRLKYEKYKIELLRQGSQSAYNLLSPEFASALVGRNATVSRWFFYKRGTKWVRGGVSGRRGGGPALEALYYRLCRSGTG